MNTPRKIFIALICIACIVSIIALIIFAPDLQGSSETEQTLPTKYEDITYGDPLDETLEFVPYFTMATEPEIYPEVIVNDNVTIKQVDKNPDEVIDRDPQIQPDDPEYLESDSYNTNVSSEGKVYRNNKKITLTVQDEGQDDTYEISFGYPAGTCNRFLYLNPSVTCNGKDEDYYFCFEAPIGGGVVENMNPATSTAEGNMCYTFLRALEERTVAQYLDVQQPGVVWFTGNTIDRPVYIDALVYNNVGYMIASVRMSIEKDASDGTYSITDLDNNNLLVQNELHPEYTAGELDYIISVADNTFHDDQKISMSVSVPDDTIIPEKCIIDYRPEESGFFYDEFIPCPGAMRSTSYYLDSGMDILAVTYKATTLESHTMYFYIVRQPGNGEHGIYQYIGRDYPSFITTENLAEHGWRQYS